MMFLMLLKLTLNIIRQLLMLPDLHIPLRDGEQCFRVSSMPDCLFTIQDRATAAATLSYATDIRTATTITSTGAGAVLLTDIIRSTI